MTYAQIDQVFPYIIFVYGAVISFVLNSLALCRLADEKLPQVLVAQLTMHRGLAALCFVFGALWILQDLWLRS